VAPLVFFLCVNGPPVRASWFQCGCLKSDTSKVEHGIVCSMYGLLRYYFVLIVSLLFKVSGILAAMGCSRINYNGVSLVRFSYL